MVPEFMKLIASCPVSATKVVMPFCLKHIHVGSNILGLCSGPVSGLDYAKKEDISRV